MTVRNVSYSLGVIAIAFASIGGDCYIGGGSVRAPRECFTGLGTQGKIRVVIGNPRLIGGPSCAGIDGLLPGTAVTLTVTKPSDPPCHATCYAYETTSVEGLDGVALVGSDVGATACSAFTLVPSYVGQFSSATLPPECPGSWLMQLTPVALPERGTVVSPFDAGFAEPWIIRRTIGFATYPPSPCGARPDAGKTCEDEFDVKRITNVTP
jgi:hypothetical protein